MEYQKNNEYEAVRLPFEKGDLAMTFILPKSNLSDFQKTMTDQKFQSIQNKFSKEEVQLYLPRFKIEYSIELEGSLKKMGLEKSFVLSNGFAKINATESLAISKVVHKTFLEVKEDDTEAAGVTAIGVEGDGPFSGNLMRINRPFLCAITDIKTGNVIFVGTL